MARRGRLAVIGAGWAGLAAAVEGCRRGHEVTVYEMAPQCGGRARSVDVQGRVLDNGQHILIGAYTETLSLLATLGVDAGEALLRLPLQLVDAQGAGLRLPAGRPTLAFARGVWGHTGWTPRERLALLGAALGWRLRGFRADAAATVAELTAALPEPVRAELIEPLCVAALNTPAEEASAVVFLRVLQDALLSGPGSADLLLPRRDLGALLPEPAARWLAARGARVHLSHRVQALEADGALWQVDGAAHDHVVLAVPPGEAARLAGPAAPDWSARARSLRYEPIVTVYLASDGARLPAPMLSLHATAEHPAQYVFDRGQLGGEAGLLAFVVSGAAPWVAQGSAAVTAATRLQAETTLGGCLGGPLREVITVTEKRATFRCTPGLARPAMHVAPGLLAAGDHVDGPYPATLEGAVRSGLAAVRAIG